MTGRAGLPAFLLLAAAAAVFLYVYGDVRAGETTVYMAGDGNDRLYTLDLTTGEASGVGDSVEEFGVGENKPRGLAAHKGKLYLAGQRNKALFELDPATGSGTRVGSADEFGLDLDNPEALASFNGVLYMLAGGGDNGLYTLNAATGAAERVGKAEAFGVGETKPTSLTAHDGRLYMVGKQQKRLYTLDAATGAAAAVGEADEFGVAESLPQGLVSAGGKLYMTGGETDALFVLDATTGAATRVAADTGKFGVNEGNAREMAALEENPKEEKPGEKPGEKPVEKPVEVTPPPGSQNNAPVFGQEAYTASLAENADGSSEAIALTTVSAADADSGDTVTYSITGGNSDGGFAISGEGAVTYAGSGVDREAAASFVLTVSAGDGKAGDTARVTIEITDVNDNPPAFGAASYSFLLAEGADGSGAAVSLGRVEAADADADAANNTVTYSITGGNGGGKFSVGASGGVAYAGSGESSDAGPFELTVTASDGRTGSADATAAVTVRVVEARQPLGSDGPKGAAAPDAPAAPTVTSGAKDRLEATFTAVSGATGYHYRHRKANAASWTEATGTAITTTTFTIGSLATGTTYEVQVRAVKGDDESGWSPSGWGKTLGDNVAPEFDESSYAAGLVKNTAGNGEGTTAPIPVIAVSATDANTDLALNTLTYSITAGNTGSKFAIDAATGAVTYVGSGETGSSDIALTVGVSDGRDAGGDADTAVDDTGTLTVSLVDSCGLQTGHGISEGYQYTETTTVNLAASCVGISRIGLASGKTLTVNGNGYTIRGVSSDDFMFRVLGNRTLELNNLTAEKSKRVIVTTQGTAKVNNVSFVDNVQAVHTAFDGTTTLKNVYFEGSSEKRNFRNEIEEGSAIRVSGSGAVTVIDSKFINNNGTVIVARANEAGTLNMDGCLSKWGYVANFSIGYFGDATPTTGECLGRTGNPGVGNDPNAKPAFDRASYAFGLVKGGVGSSNAIPAGGASAADPDAHSIYNTLAYSITAGNTGDKFAIDAATGAITYAGSGEGTTGTTFTLTVSVTDGKNASGADDTTVDDTATVKVEVVGSCGLQGEHEYAEDTTVNLAASCLGIKKVNLAAGKTLTVNGNGYTIRGVSGESEVGIFLAGSSGETLELNNITIEEAYSPIDASGGGTVKANNVSIVDSQVGVVIIGSATLDNVYFEGNDSFGLTKGNSINVVNSAATATVTDAKFIDNDDGDYVLYQTAGTLKLTGCLSKSGNTDDFKDGTITDDTTGECEGRIGNRGLGQQINGAPKLTGKVIYLEALEENADGSSEAVAIIAPPAVDPDAGSRYGSLTYALGGPDAAKFSIDRATGAISYTGSGENHEEDPPLRLQVAVTDGKDARGRADFENDATATVIVSIADEDDEIPDAPAKPALAQGPESNDLTASWTKPALTQTKGPAVTGYTVEFATGTGSDAKNLPRTSQARTRPVTS